MSRLFVDVQRATARTGGAAHNSLRLRDLVATGQVTQHTVSSPIVSPEEGMGFSGETRRTVAAAHSSCTYCVPTPVGVLHMDGPNGRAS